MCVNIRLSTDPDKQDIGYTVQPARAATLATQETWPFNTGGCP